MTGLVQRLAEDRRAAVLQILTQVEGHALNEDLLARELMRLRVGVVTREDVRALLGFLERQGLVAIERLALPGEAEELWAATATRAGRDVARGAAHPGVARPL
jgi:hypothetical protein